MTLEISRAHSFRQAPEFWAKPQNFSFAAEFWYFHRISRNFAEDENSSTISMIFDLMAYFYHGKNQTKLLKAVGPTNSYRTIVNKHSATWKIALLKQTKIGNFLCALLA